MPLLVPLIARWYRYDGAGGQTLKSPGGNPFWDRIPAPAFEIVRDTRDVYLASTFCQTRGAGPEGASDRLRRRGSTQLSQFVPGHRDRGVHLASESHSLRSFIDVDGVDVASSGPLLDVL